MTDKPLKDALLRKGYLPENVPPAFSTEKIADYFGAAAPRSFFSDGRRTVRPAYYNASKRGMTRRTFAAVHPVTGYDLAEFITKRWTEIEEFFEKSPFSVSAPKIDPNLDRALTITPHSELEKIKLTRLSSYRFIATTDISRFYHSIYTHSIPWAYHGKPTAKADRNPQSARVYFNRADHVLRCGQDGQTMGIPVGPDASRVLAEVVSTAIDLEFQRRCDIDDCRLIRHVDDVWIGAHSHADVERALSRYREAIREFELDINENKTRIYSEDFKFSDIWPTDLASKFEFAIGSADRLVAERLRAAFGHAFAYATQTGDDGVIKYAIRYVDRSTIRWKHWEAVEPFLKRAVVHYGHTIDYVARVIVWRHLSHGDVDIAAWSEILCAILDKHGRLGNDSEVCWTLYACIRLNIRISREVAERIVKNCGSLSIVALLNGVQLGLVDAPIFKTAREIIALEDATGRYWPLYMEWVARQWLDFKKVKDSMNQPLIHAMAEKDVTILDVDRLPPVFADIEEADFGEVEEAIERRVSQYDDEDDDDENKDDENPFAQL